MINLCIHKFLTWGGNWRNAVKNYLLVQVLKNEQRFNSWVELSADISNEKIILHSTRKTNRRLNVKKHSMCITYDPMW